VRSIRAGLSAAGVLFIIAVAGACTETLDSSAGCPSLCADQAGEIATITLDPVVLDTTVSALTGQGTETSMLLASRGDTLDSRAVIRFDSIPARYTKSTLDTTSIEITTVDSAKLTIRIDTTGAKIPGPVTIDAYDVDTDAPDSLTAPVAALFTPDRLIASKTFANLKDTLLKDTLRIELPGDAILSRRGQRLRIGLKARAEGSVQFRIFAVESGVGPEQLSFRVSSDTTIKPIVLAPLSKTPTTQASVASSLSDYTLLVNGPPQGPPEALNVGGLPARRSYLRFNIPPFIVDTAEIIRATLLLTQRPDRSVDPKDTVRIIAHVSLAATAVTDITRASQITAQTNLDTLKVAPGDSGLKLLEVAQLIALWHSQNVQKTPRAIVLVSGDEGQAPQQGRFFSIEASPELRPRLRISYSTRKSRGLP
jgi:hypothetical protein